MGSIEQFCKEQYQFEHERKDRLNGEVSVILTGLTLALSLIAFLISKLIWPLTVEIAISGFLLSPSVYFITYVFQSLWQLFNGYRYEYVASCPEMLVYNNQLYDYEEKFGHPGEAENLFARSITDQYAHAAGINRHCNDAKAGLLLRIKKYLFCSIIPCILAALYVSIAAQRS